MNAAGIFSVLLLHCLAYLAAPYEFIIFKSSRPVTQRLVLGNQTRKILDQT